ncbi:MAG: cytochrome-c peroxidase [Rhizobiaceae bacterium]
MRLARCVFVLTAFCAATSVGISSVAAQEAPKRLEQSATPVPPFNYAGRELPPHIEALSELDNTPADNPVTDAGAHLGRVLFYDRQLSKNGLISCGSCHTAVFGFDDQTRFSIGFLGKITRRAAMPLANARFNPRGRYFRDERAATLEEQVIDPFTDPIEMGLEPGEAVLRIKQRKWYLPLFDAAFGDENITDQRIALALAQFVRSMVSTSSRYDKAKMDSPPGLPPTEPFSQFNDQENRGKYLFFADQDQGGAGCASCHETDAFIMLHPRNNGLQPLKESDDNGLGEITGKDVDMGLFRAASLKNTAVTAPYMHDGRFGTLAEVVDHYSENVLPHPNLSPELRQPDGSPTKFSFSEKDKAALLAFLATLTDNGMMNDERFSDPFLADPD